ncbi:6-aminohexanoate hydrolase [Phytoactinopolyspora halotolerans]|uniref:6-aminohexanoate hydrolase n=1 Tax=Phytoactinopolyspora halotolerans TaxID=1981512 RepID=A0A6L9S524_9ACTN|nr:6-aminohexanoate hydrolase [Phytoactinopolyspora halotolerans]
MSSADQPRLAPPSAFAPDAIGNADVSLVPQPSPGRGSVEFDIPGVAVGTAEYGEGPTGCTVLHVPAGARTAVDARGGAVGLSGGYEFNHAICLSGGSVYGMSAAAGVSAELLERHRNRVRWTELQLVSAGVIYDFSARDNAIFPDETLGRAAVRHAAEGRFPVGRCGAGSSASVGKMDFARAEFAGQGAAYRAVGDVKVLVGTVVNAIGAVVDRSGAVVRGNYHATDGARRHPAVDYESAIAGAGSSSVDGATDRNQGADAEGGAGGTRATRPGGNTTLTVLVTNVKLSDYSLNQLARQVHSSMHRAIQPFHTENDGDVLFALTTDEVELGGTKPTGLGALASEVAWDAVLSSVA